MKRLRKLSLLVISCLIINCLPLNTPAQVSSDQATGQIVDAWISVASMAFPEAGAVLEVGKQLMDMLDVFGKSGGTVDALKLINERLDRIQTRITELETKVQALKNDFFKEKNYTRIQLLRTKRELLQNLAIQIKNPSNDLQTKRDLVKAVQGIADDFLDPELWSWSDGRLNPRTKQWEMVDPDFKSLPTLELYATALATWMAAIENTGDDPTVVKLNYGPALLRHITYLTAPRSIRSVRGDTIARIASNYGVTSFALGSLNGFDDPRQPLTPGTEVRLPTSLAENLKARIYGSITSIDKWPANRVCNYDVYITNNMTHRSIRVGPGQVQVATNDAMCQIPESMGHVPEEDRIQRSYGLDVMQRLADNLDRLRARGTLATGYSGDFDKTSYQQDFLYAVRPDGQLLFFRHLLGTKPQAPPADTRRVTTPSQSVDMSSAGSSAGTTSAGSRAGVLGRTRNTGTGVDTPAANSPVGRASNTGRVVTPPAVDLIHKIEGPRMIGGGWDQYRDVMPAGKDSIYALTADGTLNWYRVDNSWSDVGSPQLKGPVAVGSGWERYQRIVPGGDGILYAIDANGTLQWYRHSGYQDGSTSWSGPIDIYPGKRSPLTNARLGRDWSGFKAVFSGGEGVIYTIDTNGVLQWYHHRGYLNGTPEWDGPVNVGTGWQDFTHVFSPGDGIIFAIKPTGEVLWYKHAGYKDGSLSWQGPTQIASDWSEFTFVFPRMTGTWTPPVVH